MTGQEPGAREDPFGPEAGPAPEIMDVVRATPLAVVIMEVPSERIVAASPSAEALLAPEGQPVVGRSLEDFAADEPSGALELLLAGRLNGYETRRQMRRDGERFPLQLWIRSVDQRVPPRFVLGVLWAGEGRVEALLPSTGHGRPSPPVVGTVDAELLLERISSDITLCLGHDPHALLGQSILRIVEPTDVASLLWALAQATTSRSGVTLPLGVLTAEGRSQLCQLLLMPLVPPPSFAFVLHRYDEATPPLDTSPEGLWGVGRDIESAGAWRGLASLTRPDVPGLSTLTSRELDIVGRLLGGDRVPAIAQALFLSQSTVRNHLSSAFRKLRVTSQQELIDLLRRTDGPPRRT
jgi:DNA-binding CsgD family transcriptional regulator